MVIFGITSEKRVILSTLIGISFIITIKIVRKIVIVIVTAIITTEKKGILNVIKINENKTCIAIIIKTPFISPITPYTREIIIIITIILA